MFTLMTKLEELQENAYLKRNSFIVRYEEYSNILENYIKRDVLYFIRDLPERKFYVLHQVLGDILIYFLAMKANKSYTFDLLIKEKFIPDLMNLDNLTPETYDYCKELVDVKLQEYGKGFFYNKVYNVHYKENLGLIFNYVGDVYEILYRRLEDKKLKRKEVKLK